jgi:hypothetical protein
MKNILLVIYEDLNTEARGLELLSIASQIGHTTVLTYKDFKSSLNINKEISSNSGKRNFLFFFIKSIYLVLKNKYDYVFLHDNYTAFLIPLIKRINSKSKIIYDSSELYIMQTPKNLKDRIAFINHYFEKKYMKKANLVLAANIDRAEIMKEYFNLNQIPLVFDNNHYISEVISIKSMQQKYTKYTNMTNLIVYGGGISLKRRTFELMNAISKFKDMHLVIMGTINKRDLLKFNQIKRDFPNVDFLGFIPRLDFKYFLSICKFSVSLFSMDNLNNIFCASGKIFESIYLGKPILTSINPPLKNLCNEFNVGVSSNDLVQGIEQLMNRYDFYKNNVNVYNKNNNYQLRLINLKNLIEKSLHD